MAVQKQRRKRGVVLTSVGFKKLQEARSQAEFGDNGGERYTLEELSDRTQLAPYTVAKVLACEEGVDKQTLVLFFKAFNLELAHADYDRLKSEREEPNQTTTLPTRCSWGEAIDVSVFFGRTDELAKLEYWILQQRCRLVALVGMGGIGKTALSVKLAEQIQDRFEFVIWRSLRNAPPLQEILAHWIEFLSDGETDLSEHRNQRISQLIDYLRSSRCLLILDNVESILDSGAHVGRYRDGYEEYGELLRRVGEASHQSCLMLTTREKPKKIACLEGGNLPVRSLPLMGLNVIEGQEIFRSQNHSHGSESDWKTLIQRYIGNFLALRIVATTIQEIFNNSISGFLAPGEFCLLRLVQIRTDVLDTEVHHKDRNHKNNSWGNLLHLEQLRTPRFDNFRNISIFFLLTLKAKAIINHPTDSRNYFPNRSTLVVLSQVEELKFVRDILFKFALQFLFGIIIHDWSYDKNLFRLNFLNQVNEIGSDYTGSRDD